MANDKGYNGKKTRAIKFRQYQHKQALQSLLRKKSQTHWNSNINKIQRKIKKQQEEYQEQNVNRRITTSRNWKMSQYRQRERNSNGHQKLEKKRTSGDNKYSPPTPTTASNRVSQITNAILHHRYFPEIWKTAKTIMMKKPNKPKNETTNLQTNQLTTSLKQSSRKYHTHQTLTRAREKERNIKPPVWILNATLDVITTNKNQ